MLGTKPPGYSIDNGHIPPSKFSKTKKGSMEVSPSELRLKTLDRDTLNNVLTHCPFEQKIIVSALLNIKPIQPNSTQEYDTVLSLIEYHTVLSLIRKSDEEKMRNQFSTMIDQLDQVENEDTLRAFISDLKTKKFLKKIKLDDIIGMSTSPTNNHPILKRPFNT